MNIRKITLLLVCTAWILCSTEGNALGSRNCCSTCLPHTNNTQVPVEPAFGSLIFPARLINSSNQSTNPDSHLTTGTTPSPVYIEAWTLSPPSLSTKQYTVTFNLPYDFVDGSNTEALISFLTDDNGDAANIVTGNAVLQLSVLSAAPNTNSPTGPATVVTSSPGIPVQSSSSATGYNYYQTSFNLGTGYAPGDFILLTITRVSPDSYAPNLFLTSIEFKYAAGT